MNLKDCDKCDGKGLHEAYIDEKYAKEYNYSYMAGTSIGHIEFIQVIAKTKKVKDSKVLCIIKCEKCKGFGKLDWIEMLTGKLDSS